MKKEKLIDAVGLIDDRFIEEAHETNKESFFKKINWSLIGKIEAGILCILLLVVALPVILPSSGKSADSAYQNAKSSEAPIMDETAGMAYVYGGSGAENENITIEKKLIVSGQLRMETLDFDNVLNELYTNIEKVDGYIQSSSIFTRNNEARYFEATIRIPANAYNDFVRKTKASGNTLNYSESVEDITDSYYDLEARIRSLKSEEAKVLEFYDKASSIEELMSIENRLTEIRYEIDASETRIKNYDLLTSYSTLNITIEETKIYTKTNDGFFARLGLSFKNGFSNFINGLENFVIDIAYNIWTILFVVIVASFGVYLYIKFKKKRNAKR